MPTRSEVLRLVDDELPSQAIGEQLGILPGLAHLLATGVPAGGGDVLSGTDQARAGISASTRTEVAPAGLAGQPAANAQPSAGGSSR